MTDEEGNEFVYADAYAQRAEAILRLCCGVDAVKDKRAKDTLISASERIMLTMEIKERKATVSAIKRDSTSI